MSSASRTPRSADCPSMRAERQSPNAPYELERVRCGRHRTWAGTRCGRTRSAARPASAASARRRDARPRTAPLRVERSRLRQSSRAHSAPSDTVLTILSRRCPSVWELPGAKRGSRIWIWPRLMARRYGLQMHRTSPRLRTETRGNYGRSRPTTRADHGCAAPAKDLASTTADRRPSEGEAAHGADSSRR
jgi:hypothetical protein